MLNNPTFLLAAFGALVVLGILLFGIATFAKGGDFNKRNANKIMRWRLIAQFAAVVLVLAFGWISTTWGR